ncbi:M13 family peptidase, partial [Streptococcus suis]
ETMRKKLNFSLVEVACAKFLTACGTINSSAPKAGEATQQTDFHSYINAQCLKNTKIGDGESQIDNLSQLSEKTHEA